MSRHVVWSKLSVLARKATLAGIDVIFPPACLLCGEEIQQSGLLCAGCFAHLVSVGQPFCVRCALPQSSAECLNAERECLECVQHPPPWHAARSAFVYEKTARDLLLRLKYADCPEYASFAGRYMWQAGEDVLRQGALVIPVPVHKKRLMERRYNQAALLAWAVARCAKLRCLPDGLERRRVTGRLAGFTKTERQQEMEGAITVRSAYMSDMAGRDVVLVDDLLTTGATASACTKALLQAGVRSVFLLVAARVVLQKNADFGLSILEDE